jgi:hypothetical protein
LMPASVKLHEDWRPLKRWHFSFDTCPSGGLWRGNGTSVDKPAKALDKLLLFHFKKREDGRHAGSGQAATSLVQRDKHVEYPEACYMSSRVSRSLRDGGIVRTLTDSCRACVARPPAGEADMASEEAVTRSTNRLMVS